MKMKGRNLHWGKLIGALALPLAVGGLSAWLTRDGMKSFEALYKPALTPPGWVFPAAWTVLYLLMGLASYQVITTPASPERRRRAVRSYLWQLLINGLWPLLFFGAELFGAAALWLVGLLALSVLCALRFQAIRESAGKLLLPYLLWLCFALYLNLGVWLLN